MGNIFWKQDREFEIEQDREAQVTRNVGYEEGLDGVENECCSDTDSSKHGSPRTSPEKEPQDLESSSDQNQLKGQNLIRVEPPRFVEDFPDHEYRAEMVGEN